MENHLLVASNIHTNCDLSDVIIGQIWFALLYLRIIYKHRTIKWNVCFMRHLCTTNMVLIDLLAMELLHGS